MNHPTSAVAASSGKPIDSNVNSSQDELSKAVQARDRTRLRQLAVARGGFASDQTRSRVWPILLGVPGSKEQAATMTPPSKDDLPPHNDERQVHLDILRSFVSYPTGASQINLSLHAQQDGWLAHPTFRALTEISDEEKQRLRDQLENVIVTILRRHPSLHYFQGYHDIISILLLTFKDEDLTIQAAEMMSLHRLRDSMGAGLEPVLGYLRILHRILYKHDADLARMVDSAASLPYFSLSWVLTLMSHDLTSVDLISRLFDFLLAHNPVMISYLGVAIVLLKKEQLAQLEDDDPAMIHHTLAKVPNLVLDAPTTSKEVHELGIGTEHDLGSALYEHEDEDLMSSYQRSDSLLSTSIISNSEASTDWGSSSTLSQLATSSNYSLQMLDDSIFEDPDIVGLAFPSSAYQVSIPDVLQAQASSSNMTLLERLNDEPPKKQPKKAGPPGVSIEELIETTLKLYQSYPYEASEDRDNSIQADQVMGPKSCIFTWPLSIEGRLTDRDADLIAEKGVDIVLTEAVEADKKEEGEDGPAIEDPLERRARRRKELKARRKRMEFGAGMALAIAGVAGVLLATYGGTPLLGNGDGRSSSGARGEGAGKFGLPSKLVLEEWTTWGGEVVESLRVV
ncbi:BQ2448_5048 [Microbotryum intermedium]|uniref:BQ2448_5048 protein n=1 Tax=Microbotryum intermedium TaxID=269621 RepID=A0A238F306_9BASI|nr:BQ2448_5048 [Microbotryum intermedium]